MRWWASATAVEIAHLTAQLAESRARENYWRTRAEKLMDAALARKGEIHEPTMREAVVPRDANIAGMIASALSVTEFDSTKQARV